MRTADDENRLDGFAPARGLALAGAATAFSAPQLKIVEPVVGQPWRRPTLMRRESLHRRLLATADLIAAGLALVIVLLATGSANPDLAIIVGTPLVVVMFKIAGLYDRDQMRLVHSTLDEAPTLLQLTGLYVLVVTIVTPALSNGSLSPAQTGALWILSFLATVSGRSAARWLAGKASPEERCLVVGEPELVTRIRDKIASSHARATVVAMLPLDGDEIDGLRNPESVRRLVEGLKLDRIVLAPRATDTRGVVELIRVAKAAEVRVSVLPRMLEAVGSAVEFDNVDGLTMVGVRPFGLSRSSRFLKRSFDLVASAIGLLAVAPILAVIAIAIKLDTKGPLLFRQIRVGRDGRPFWIFKFRSMVVDAEDRKQQLLSLSEVGDSMFKLKADPRVTRVGAFLRKTSLDEMPQLFNVLRGDMSLVGPRPLVRDEDARVRGIDRSRLHLTPGMTGPWQVLGARVPMQEMVAIDYLYVANWSLWADVKLLMRTVRHVARRGNM
jgi:exopolysaccharide biosynthesis polyprenyl glycosylphosphotransferase